MECGQLKKHKKNVNDIDVTWFLCDQHGCGFKSKTNGNLTQHKAMVHNVDVKWFLCDQPNCSYKSKKNSHLKRHKTYVHNIDVRWFLCDHINCGYKCKQNSSLKQHKINAHNMAVTLFSCDHHSCDYKCKTKGSLKQHKANVHSIGVTLFSCDQAICGYKCKTKGNLKQHKASAHNIGVTWFSCDQLNCNYKCKKNSHLKRHKISVHDIGNFTCSVCAGACGSLTAWKDPITQCTLNACRKCYRKCTGCNTRVEKQVVDWLNVHFAFPMLRQDQRVNGDACLRYRPDIMYRDALAKLTIYVEVDEHQHKWNNDSYKCDERRMSELYDETSGTVVFIRYNPHTYVPPAGVPKLKSGDERRNVLLRVLNGILESGVCAPLSAIYVCYDVDSDRVAQNIPVQMVFQ